jgi:hypothetical protein
MRQWVPSCMLGRVLDEPVGEAVSHPSQIIIARLLRVLFARGHACSMAVADFSLGRDEALLVVGELSHFIG